MNRLSFFLLGLLCGATLVTLHVPRRQSHSKTNRFTKGFDHESQINETAQPSLSFVATALTPSAPARIVVETVAKRSAQADILNMIANFKTAKQIIFETNEPARRLFDELR